MLREISLLLVEDDQSIQEALAELLRGEGYRVQTASCCQEAILSSKEKHFDLVLLDLNLGEENGWVVFESLKRQRHDLPIVIISGHPSRFESNPLGRATAVLEKPLDVPVFLNVLREATEPPTRGPLKTVACAMGLALLVAGLSVPFKAQAQQVNSPQVRNGLVTVSWQGGGATNQLQTAPALDGPWTDVDVPTSASSVTYVMSQPTAFYRVLNVDQMFATAADKKAPSTPTGLSAVAIHCNRIDLSWTASSDSGQNASGLQAYNIYRNGLFLKQVQAPANSTWDTSVAASTFYSYTISAVDRARNTSSKSAAASANTPTCGGNQPPIANAGSDISVTPGSSVILSANGSYDPDGSISSYVWDFGDGTGASGPSVWHAYSFPGVYSIRLTVTDNAGASGSDTSVATVITVGDTTPPSVSLSAPGNGSTLSGSVTFTATASDDTGVARVEYYLDNSTLASVTAPPYAFSWDSASVGNGIHTVYAKAYDAAGNASVSPTHTVTVSNGGTTTGGQALLQRQFGGIGYGSGAVTKQTVVDRNGNVILVGAMLYTVDFGTGPITSAGDQDAFIAKYDNNGQCLWVRRLGNVSSDMAYGVALDSADNILVTGVVSGPIWPGTLDFGTGPQPCKGGSDVFLVKYSPNGTHLWTRVFGGSGSDIGIGVGIDSADNILLTGTHAFFGTGADFGGGSLPAFGKQDVYLVKLNSAGGYVWGRSFGGAEGDLVTGIALDSTGNPVLVGHFWATANFGGGTVTSAGETDVFIAKYSGADGNNMWQKRLGDVRNQASTGVTVDGSGNVIVTGDFLGMIDFGGSLQIATPAGSFFVAKYTASGALSWAKSYGAEYNAPHSAAVTVDGSGQIIVVGEMITGIDFGTGWLLGQGGNDALVLKFSPSGSVMWARRGAPAGDRGTAVAIDRRNGNIILGGDCGNLGVDFGCQNIIRTPNTSNNAFWIKFAP